MICSCSLREGDDDSPPVFPIQQLSGYHTQERNVYAVYSSRQYVDAKVTLFIEALKSSVGAELNGIARELIEGYV